jgi:hypothetical protein
VQSTGPADDDTNTIARFYSSTDCSEGTQISEGNVGCVGVAGGGFGSYQSFKIDYTPLDDLPILPDAFSVTSTITASGTAIEARAVQTATLPAITPTVSPEPAPFIHGEMSYHKGVPYRWQQVHASGFMGIDPDEWDDAVHIQNLLPPPPLADYVASHNLSARASLEDRSLNEFCQIAGTCTNRLIGGASLGAQALAGSVAAYWTQVDALARAKGVKISDFMGKHPFYQDIVSSKCRTWKILYNISHIHTNTRLDVLAGVPSGLFTNWLGGLIISTNPANIANCSIQQTQLDAILSACQAQTVTLTETSSVTVTALDTQTNTVTIISMSVIRCGFANEGDQCGMPTGSCIAPPGQ